MEQPEVERELHDLSRRIAQIEERLGMSEAAVSQPVPIGPMASPPIETVALLPVLGGSLLALAGAYLLRAFTESGSLPARAGVAIGVLYAIAWLVRAARAPAARRLDAAVHSLTSVLVLAPLLWEATLRFHAISTWTASAILLIFTVCALAVSWRKNLLVVATIATLCSLGTAAALLLATHDVLPFTIVFLATAASVEASACLDHWLSERWLAALAADLSVLLATWLVTRDQGLPAGYAPIPHTWLVAAQVALLAIYLSSTIVRTLLRHFTFSFFEIAQCAAAFLIGVTGGLRLSHQDPQVAPAMAGLALACAAACYVVSFVLLDRTGARGRNFHTYATFGILLALAGTRILLSGGGAALAWSALAIACVAAGTLSGRLTLQVHGGMYLLLALFTSGAFAESAGFLLGTADWPGAREGAMMAGSLTAAACYGVVVRWGRTEPGPWSVQCLRVALAAAVAWLVAGIAAGGLASAYHAIWGASASHAYCATLRTGLISCGALLLAWAGARWHRAELSRLMYPAMLLGAYLVADALRQEEKAALVISLLVYGMALMALPRLKADRVPAA